MLELCGMQRTPSMPSLLGPLGPEVVAADKGFLTLLFFAFKLGKYMLN